MQVQGMAQVRTGLVLLVLSVIALAGCGGGGGDGDGDANEAIQFALRDMQDPTDVLDTALLRAFKSATIVECTLDNGFKTTCHQLVFDANPVAAGPFCPPTTADLGGYGIYDGATGSGLRALNAALFTDMETDGYDIVDDAGNVRIQDPGADNAPNTLLSFCLQATADDSLELTFLIPVRPLRLTTPNTIETVELLGVSLDGVPFAGTPPSAIAGTEANPVALGTARLPALDPCGGHFDPAGYLHRHFVAETIAEVFTEQNIIDGLSCDTVAQDNAALVGFAKDGYPIYGILDANGSTPLGLDICNGHEGTTADYDLVYHYHASTDVPSLPTCVSGASVVDGVNFRVQ